MSTIVHVKRKTSHRKPSFYCDADIKKNANGMSQEWVEPFVVIEIDPSALRIHGGWMDRSICYECILKAQDIGHLTHKHLYAIHAERRTVFKNLHCWVPCPLRYMHAVSELHARRVFFANHHPMNTRIKFIGRVIGYHAHDEHGDVLSA